MLFLIANLAYCSCVVTTHPVGHLEDDVQGVALRADNGNDAVTRRLRNLWTRIF